MVPRQPGPLLSGMARSAGVVGSPIQHSLSPLLHRAAYAALGLDGWSYHRTEVPAGALAAYVAGLGPQWAGLSVTMPGKEEALALAREAGPEAGLVGAANTLTRVGGGWRADNTDVPGVLAALRESGVCRVESAVLVGSGATARSVMVALAGLGVQQVRVLVRERVREGTVDLAGRLGLSLEVERYADLQPGSTRPADVVVSTVPVGATPPADRLDPVAGLVVLDVVYAPWPTPFAAELAGRGARVVGGESMLLHQAAEQVRLMTGMEPPVSAMRAALATRLPETGR